MKELLTCVKMDLPRGFFLGLLISQTVLPHRTYDNGQICGIACPRTNVLKLGKYYIMKKKFWLSEAKPFKKSYIPKKYLTNNL